MTILKIIAGLFLFAFSFLGCGIAGAIFLDNYNQEKTIQTICTFILWICFSLSWSIIGLLFYIGALH